jgi:hypothetical protein
MAASGFSLTTLARRGVLCGTLGICAAYASAFFPASVGRAGPYVMAFSVPLCLISVMLLGAARRAATAPRARRVLAVSFALVFVLVGGGFLLALQLPVDTVAGPYWLGLPPRAAVILYGVGLVPLFLLPLVYAWSFEPLTLSDADLARVRAARRTLTDTPTDGSAGRTGVAR